MKIAGEIKIDDEVRVISGPFEGRVAFVSAMCYNSVTKEIDSLMISNATDDDEMINPDDVETTGNVFTID